VTFFGAFFQFISFEVIMTVAINWCQQWFEFFPNPPINVRTGSFQLAVLDLDVFFPSARGGMLLSV